MHAHPPAVLFRDALAPAALSACRCFTGVQSVWTITDEASLSDALAAADRVRAAGGALVFALDYEMGALLEPGVMSHAVSSSRIRSEYTAPLGYIWHFSTVTRLTCDEADAWLLGRGGADPAGCVRGQPAQSAAAYADKLSGIHAAIAAGEVYQVNYTFPIDVMIYGAPANVFLNLARAQPTAHAVYMDLPEAQVMSLSPELFFTVTGDRITVKPMKGTAPRAADPQIDQQRASGLRASEKNRAENLMIVDLLRNDLGRVAVPGSVKVDALFDIEPYATVHQMTSTVSATLRTCELSALVPALFPCGSVTGAPKVAAMQKIRAWEIGPRGLYTGSIGWATADDVYANVAIRTLVLDPPVVPEADTLPETRSAVLGVGSGIVWDSDPADEYAECLLKSAFLTHPDPGFTLFETLRLELPPDELEATLPLVEIYPRVRLHRDRLQASAEALGFAFDAAGFEQVLWEAKAEIRQKQGNNAACRVYRVRVDLSHAGDFTFAWSALPPMADRVAVIWADTVLHADNPLLQHKTSARTTYDAAIDRALAQQAFDALFCNTLGQVCEGARSNIFVREGRRLLTPPLRCGLLPGVLRRELLATGAASESLLTMNDIKTASREGRLRVGNGLRGLMQAYLKSA